MVDQGGSDATHGGHYDLAGPSESLNVDILRLVCNCLSDVSDVLSFSLTCPTFREGALQRRLRMSPVVLRPFGVSIGWFYSFIFQDPAGRAPHIYGLKLSDWDYKLPINDMPDDMSRRLVDLLEAAIHIEYLYLSDIDLPHVVLATMEKLTTLRHLSMCTQSATDDPFKLLTALRSPLEYLRISSVHEIYNLPASFFAPSIGPFRFDSGDP